VANQQQKKRTGGGKGESGILRKGKGGAHTYNRIKKLKLVCVRRHRQVHPDGGNTLLLCGLDKSTGVGKKRGGKREHMSGKERKQ